MPVEPKSRPPLPLVAPCEDLPVPPAPSTLRGASSAAPPAPPTAISPGRRSKRRVGLLALPLLLGALLLLSPGGPVVFGALEASLSGASTQVHTLAPGVAPSPSPAPQPSSAPLLPQGSSCPDGYYYGQSFSLTLQQVVNCALQAGFTGPAVITFASMAWQESNFVPGAVGGQAEGILQENLAGTSPPQGAADNIQGTYDPATCSQYGTHGWGGVYFDPTCAFRWAHAFYTYYQANPGALSPCPYGGYCFWGSYGGNQWAGYSEAPGQYCQWVPQGFGGTGGETCPSGYGWVGLPSSVGSWSSICPGNVCNGAGSGGAPAYDAASAVAYADTYWDEAVSDGYFFEDTYCGYGWGQAVYLGPGAPLSSCELQHGVDCAHFVSSALAAGGISFAADPNAYGGPITGDVNAQDLVDYLISAGLAAQVSSPSELVPGDVIGYDEGTGSVQHVALVVAVESDGPVVDAHTASNYAAPWSLGYSSSDGFVLLHMLGSSPGPSPPCKNLAPGGVASVHPSLARTSPSATPAASGTGYWLVGADGGVFSFGASGFYGSAASLKLGGCIVGMAPTPDGKGYWLAGADGGVLSFGDAKFYGSMGGKTLNAPVVGIAATPNGGGYWLVSADGGVFAFGNAPFLGSMAGHSLNAPVVGIAGTPNGQGYWLVAGDGGVFAFGNAPFLGSMAGTPLNAPVVGIAPTPSGLGYWLGASDGGVFSFGNANFYGSMGGRHMNAPVVGIAPTPDGNGYWLVGADGGIFSFGSAAFLGSMGGRPMNAPVVGMAVLPPPIVPPPPPSWSVSISALPTSGTAPLSVSLTAQINTTARSVSNTFTFAWDLGNGATGNTAAISTTYASAGSYLASLTVTNSTGVSQGSTVTITVDPPPPTSGYWMTGADGGVFSFGNASYDGGMAGRSLNAPVVGMAPLPDGQGYWLVGADGGVFSFGAANFYGSMAGASLSKPVVGIAASPTGNGYWLAGADGGIFAFGPGAPFEGSLPGLGVSVSDIVGIAAVPGGGGYWLVGADGGVFAFGSAPFKGSLPGDGISVDNIVGMAPTPDGQGYWLVASNGAVYTFGDATYDGDMAGQTLNAPVLGISSVAGGTGYVLFAADGGVFTFGSASFYGSMAGQSLNAPVVGGCEVP
jgi:PKD repeat protein